MDQQERSSGATGSGVVAPLVAMAMAIFVIANDVTAMSVALPAIEGDFDADVSTVQWVVNAYALIFGVLIVTGGRLADMFGRRRCLFIGAAVFAAFSAIGGLAPNIGVLIACRALMGIGGALMWPAILGLVYAILPASRAGLAGGLVIGTAGLGNAAGPLLGGALTQALSWRWILFLNVPIALVACLVTWRTVHVAQQTDRDRIDYAGIATLSIGLIALLVGLGQAPDAGWTDPMVLGSFALCAVLLAGFVLVERRAGSAALVPADVMANRTFVGACLATLLMSATFFASLLYLPQFLQKILGYTAFGAGAGLLPLMLVFTGVSFAAGALYNRLGARVVIGVGAAAITVGGLLLSLLQAESGYFVLVPGMVVLGFGVGLFYSAITTAGVTALPESRSSLAGGILYMFQIAGGAIGLGLTTTVFLTASNRSLDDGTSSVGVALTAAERASARGVLAGTDTAAELVARYAGSVGQALEDLVREAFASGFQWALRFDAALALVGLVVAVALIRPHRAD
jgi:EmrB/QacA subfamily drug resistance transporter